MERPGRQATELTTAAPESGRNLLEAEDAALGSSHGAVTQRSLVVASLLHCAERDHEASSG